MARKRFLFFHRRHSFHLLKREADKGRRGEGQQPSTPTSRRQPTFTPSSRIRLSNLFSLFISSYSLLCELCASVVAYGKPLRVYVLKKGVINPDLVSPKTKSKPKANLLFCLLFLSTFLLSQGFAWFWGATRLPVLAHSPAVVTVTQESANPQTLVEQGKQLYDAGKFSEAAAVLKTAAEAFKAQGNPLKAAMTLSNLALAYQQLGTWAEAEQALKDSLNLLQSKETVSNLPSGKKTERLQILAQTLDIQGRLQLSRGQPEQALQTWQQAAATHAQIGNQDGKLQSQINQAQALQSLGFYTRACKTLLNGLGIDNDECQISNAQLQTLKSQPDSLTQAIALRSLGDALQLVGDLQQAENVLKVSLDIAQRLRSPQNVSATLFSLGNTVRAQRTIDTDSQSRTATTAGALVFYQQAAEAATSPMLKLQALLNQLSLLIETQQFAEAQALSVQIQSQLDNLPPSRTGIYARINLAQSLMKLSTSQREQAAQLLAKAVEQAKQLGDQRATTYALGNLGELYEQTGQLGEAKNLTEQALVLAQTINAPDIAFRWQWQLGRLLKAQGDAKNAIAAYSSAVETLKDLRKELVSINPEVQFSFRESVEPVYRQLVGLLLESQGRQADKQNLAQARDVIESLQQAELVNFFREDCLTGTLKTIDEIDEKGESAVIYPIVLPDRLEVVLSLPNGSFRQYTTGLPQAEVERVFTQLREVIAPSAINPTRGEGTEPEPNLNKDTEPKETDPNRGIVPQPREGTLNECRGLVPVPTTCQPSAAPQQYLPLAQKLYDWLIRPAEQDIANSKVQTLVFVLDGPMLNLPMAILQDGQQFLIEKYAIAYTPGLQLLDSKRLVRGQITALKAGLTQSREITLSSSQTPIVFSALPFVKEELETIQLKVKGELLLDEEFTTTAIQKEINSVPFPVVHLATHGQFSSKQEDTFILTWDDRLSVNQLNTMLRSREETGRNPIELLVLSACQTAAGDERAALGLAGVAVRAGARSTLATLWLVSDEGTAELMTRFYQELTDTSISKAEALRRAQVALLKDSRYQLPRLWAPYVLVGNWL
jgi:CHAT domain-containing protein